MAAQNKGTLGYFLENRAQIPVMPSQHPVYINTKASLGRNAAQGHHRRRRWLWRGLTALALTRRGIDVDVHEHRTRSGELELAFNRSTDPRPVRSASRTPWPAFRSSLRREIRHYVPMAKLNWSGSWCDIGWKAVRHAARDASSRRPLGILAEAVQRLKSNAIALAESVQVSQTAAHAEVRFADGLRGKVCLY